MKLQDIQWLDLSLERETYRNEANDTIKKLISTGDPFVADIFTFSAAKKEEPSAEIILMKEKYNFYYLNFPLNVKPDNDHEIRFISLEIDILSGGNESICWSLDPMRIDQEIKVSTEAKLSATLGLHIFEAGSESTTGQEFINYFPAIQAFGLRQNNPYWEIKKVNGKKIAGIMIFHMIIRVRKGNLTTAKVKLRTDIFKKGTLWTYNAFKANNSMDLFNIELS